MFTPRDRATLAAALAVAVGVLATGCDRQPTSPAVARAGVAADAAIVTGKVPFTFYANAYPPAVADCLGGPIHFFGPVSGWWEAHLTSSGQEGYQEYDDFSNLTATQGSQTWTAAPGSHEIWAENFPIGTAGMAAVLVHEGSTRFLSNDGAPTLLFRHSIHVLERPDGTIEHDNVTVEVECLGVGG